MSGAIIRRHWLIVAAAKRYSHVRDQTETLLANFDSEFLVHSVRRAVVLAVVSDAPRAKEITASEDRARGSLRTIAVKRDREAVRVETAEAPANAVADPRD